MKETVKKRIRCAIYTRKSTEEGLDMEYNTLDAQRDAAEAFILSQRHEGWTLVDDHYDDGGFSGGNMDRPALKRLLADIKNNLIDVVVVYKIDRLTRSLMDFSQLVTVFDQHNVSFVSVTQQFNTTSSMGRLTLNILLSFAQFEREVTGERIRDKVPASEILHIYRPQRPGQIRGVPWVAPALVKLFLLDQYDDAELDRKKVSALFAGFITKNSPEDNILGEGAPDAVGAAIAGLSPGTMQVLLPGEDIKFAEPADVGGAYEPFQYRNLLAACAAMGMPYTNVTGDLKAANYSSIRAGTVEFRRRLEQFQHATLVFQFCRPIAFHETLDCLCNLFFSKTY